MKSSVTGLLYLLVAANLLLGSMTAAAAEPEPVVVPLYDYNYARYANRQSLRQSPDIQMVPAGIVRSNPKPKMILLAPLALVSLYTCRNCNRNLPTETVPLQYFENGATGSMQVIKVD